MNHPIILLVRAVGWRTCAAAVALVGLWVLVAIAVAVSAQQARKEFTTLLGLQQEYDRLLERRAQLLVERSTALDLARIERVASSELSMVLPEIVVPAGRPTGTSSE